MSKISKFNLLKAYTTQFCEHETHTLKGEKPDASNLLLMQKSFSHFIYLVSDIVSQKAVSPQKEAAILSNLVNLFIVEDFSVLILSLKEAYDIIIRHISQKDTLAHYGDFKGRLEQAGYPYYGNLFTAIRDDIEDVITQNTLLDNCVYKSNVKNQMKRIAQYTLFLSKLKFSDENLELSALCDYLECESENAFHPDWSQLPITKLIINKLRLWLSDYRYDGTKSRHGSGSTADVGSCKLYKCIAQRNDAVLNHCIMYNNQYNTEPPTPSYTGTAKLKRCSKLVFVPKNIKKLRSISMEPTALQYWQQGVMVSLMDYFERNKYLKNILHLKDQNVNKSFAYTGSIDDSYSTIDLSHASDSVTYDLVKALFKKACPTLYVWLVGTRSTHTLLPDGREFRLLKFAPMGSAVCFPIESLVFAAISAVAIDLSYAKHAKSRSVTELTKTFKVYGDDIIVPSYSGALTVNLLKLYGFTPNEEKSYLHGPFKESCGGNYFCGVDITPIKYSITYDPNCESGISPETFEGLCTYANFAYEKDLPLLRLACIHELLDAGHKPVFTSELDCSPYIYSPCPTNFHIGDSVKYNKWLQVYTVKRSTVGTKLIEPKVRTMAYRALLNRIIYLEKLQHVVPDSYNPYLDAEVRRESDCIKITFDSHQRVNARSYLRSIAVQKVSTVDINMMPNMSVFAL